MKKTILGAMTAAALLMPATISPAFAQDWHNGNRGQWQGDRQGWDPHNDYRQDRRYKERRLGRDDQVYRGGDGRYYCKRNDGTTGLVIGALGGGVLGNVLGGGTLGTLLGAGGGALVGRSIDRGKVRCR